jgi:hypothetical protein
MRTFFGMSVEVYVYDKEQWMGIYSRTISEMKEQNRDVSSAKRRQPCDVFINCVA